MRLPEPYLRIELTADLSPPDEPLAVDIRDGQGRLVLRAGEKVTQNLLERLRRIGILEIFVTSPIAHSEEYWKRWGESWLETARSRMVLLTPETGVHQKDLDGLRLALENAVAETVRKKIQSWEA